MHGGLTLECELPAGLTVSNSAKFTEKGRIVVAARESEERLELSVTDSAIGIAEADLPTGLGLYLMAKLVADILRGTISVRSREVEGSPLLVGF